MRQLLDEGGQWKEGKAAPELLREDLRRLPSALVTKNLEEGEKVHEDDAPHVQEDIVCTATEGKVVKKKTVSQARQELYGAFDKPIPLTKENVAFERMALTMSLLRELQKMCSKTPGPTKEEVLLQAQVRHLWFPQDDVLILVLREGNPPADQDRPEHLKGIFLAVNPLSPDKHVVDMARDRLMIEDLHLVSLIKEAIL